ncbi:MAG TPA: DUF3617 domain-containing protein [Vicinamibacterales bacterium]|nr:DUF3617 domain-containing protein [Vicinamibacterales bacterium]
MKMLRLGAGAAAALTVTAVLVAQAPMLDVRMGLWETTATTTMNNMMAGVDTSKMNDQQKAQIEAMMKNMQGKPVVTKSCMTKEKFEKQNFMQNRPNSDCKQTVTTNTRTAMDATVVCSTPETIKGQVHIEATSPTAFKGTVHSTGSARGHEIEVSIDLSGRWLGADCGDVK